MALGISSAQWCLSDFQEVSFKKGASPSSFLFFHWLENKLDDWSLGNHLVPWGRNFVLKMMEKQSGSYWGPVKVESRSLLLSSVYCFGKYVCQYTYTNQLLSCLHHCYLGTFYKSVVFLFEIQMWNIVRL